MSARLFRLAALAGLLLLLCLAACGREQENKAEAADAALYETFDSLAAVQADGGAVSDPEDATAFTPGYVGGAYWLGDGNAIRYPARDLINPVEGTIEFWILAKDNWQDGVQRQILQLNGPSNLAVFKDAASNFPAFSVGGHALIRAEHGQFVGWNAWPQWPSRWTHIAVTWANLGDEENQGQMVLYVDGVVFNQYVGWLPRLNVEGEFTLGAWESGADANALIDELRVYKRCKPYWEFTGYAQQMPERFLPYELLVWPTPHPYGMRPEAGFQIAADTKVIFADEDYDQLADALAVLRQTFVAAYGFAPDFGRASDFFGEENFIAVGEVQKNGLVGAMAARRKLPVRPQNPGPGGYLLEVYPEGIVAASADYAGTVHGLMTLIQLIRQHADGYVPAITMVDYADFPIRAAEWVTTGLLLDDEAKRRVRYFASLKLSHLFLRTPDYLNLDDDFTRTRVLEFFEFVRRYGIEPVPLIDLLSNARFITARCAELDFDCQANGRLDTYCPCEPLVYSEVVDPALENIVTWLQPAVVHIGHDDVQTLDKDPRCAATRLSPAELFADDVNHAYDLLKGLDSTIAVWLWADMLNPLHHGSRLEEPAAYPNAPPPPDPVTLLPADLVYNMWYYAPADVWTYIMALLSLRGWEDKLLPYYTAGPVGNDIDGAVMWMRNAYDMHALGYLFRPRTKFDGPGDLSDPGWDGLPAANECAWSLFVPEDLRDVWYDYSYTNRLYGGF